MTQNRAIQVLWAEDDDLYTLLVQRSLQRIKLPMTLDRVRDGDILLRTLERATSLGPDQQPDGILLDLSMPRMPGFDVAQQIRTHEHWQSLPIMILTCSCLESDALRALELDCPLMHKPSDTRSIAHLLFRIYETLTQGTARQGGNRRADQFGNCRA